jgi:antitoxin (DNA-binding transcriptional repressor) of toxin-antitoxin stability system
MRHVSATDAAKEFHRFLGLVEHGQTVQIRKHGRAVARLIPDRDFMSGKNAAAIFRDYHAESADRAAANAIASELAKLDRDFENELAR